MERRSVLTHTIRQNEIPALLRSWLKNKPSVKMLCPQKKVTFFINLIVAPCIFVESLQFINQQLEI